MTDRVFIKGFDKNLQCRGYQFEVGKEYRIDLPEGYVLTADDLCTNKVFHFCDSLQKVHTYYSCDDKYNNRYCIIEVLGQFVENNDKCGSDHIKVIKEIKGEELNIAKGLTSGNTGWFNIGTHNSGSGNSGNYNSGYYNSGNYNSGNYNSGGLNSGNGNSGLFNSCNNSNGVFCSVEPKISIFNNPSEMTLTEFYNSKYYYAICSVPLNLTEWVNDKLITRTHKDACQIWWDSMSDENKKIIKSMPNFDVDVFCEITGIDKDEV